MIEWRRSESFKKAAASILPSLSVWCGTSEHHVTVPLVLQNKERYFRHWRNLELSVCDFSPHVPLADERIIRPNFPFCLCMIASYCTEMPPAISPGHGNPLGISVWTVISLQELHQQTLFQMWLKWFFLHIWALQLAISLASSGTFRLLKYFTQTYWTMGSFSTSLKTILWVDRSNFLKYKTHVWS